MSWDTVKVERTRFGNFSLERNSIAKGWTEYYVKHPNGRMDYVGDDYEDALLSLEGKILNKYEASHA